MSFPLDSVAGAPSDGRGDAECGSSRAPRRTAILRHAATPESQAAALEAAEAMLPSVDVLAPTEPPPAYHEGAPGEPTAPPMVSRPLRIYLAAPLVEAPAKARLASALAAWGAGYFLVVSRWHQPTTPSADPAGAIDRELILGANLADLEAADVVVADTRGEAGGARPRSTYAEIGYALAIGRPVVWLRPSATGNRSIFDAHHLVTAVDTMDELAGALWTLEAARDLVGAEVP